MQSCIDIQVRRVGDALSFISQKGGKEMGFSSCRAGDGIGVSLSRDGMPISFLTSRKGLPVAFYCSLICSVNSEFFLYVAQDAIWLTPDNGFSQDVDVIANVEWTIE